MKQKKNLLNMMSAIVFCISLCMVSCSDSNNEPEPKVVEPEVVEPEEYTGIPFIIYDTDIGSSTDDLFALRLLYYYSDMELCKLLGGIVCRMGTEYVALADLMNNYYNHGNLPLGVERNGVNAPNVYIPYSGICDLKNEDGSLMFKRSILDYSKLPDGWKLYRKLLSSQPDKSVKICAIGFMSTIVQLLKSGPDEYSTLTGKELVEKKVKGLYVMGGKFGEIDNTKPGYNFGHKEALQFSKELFELWPTSTNIYFSPSLIGDDVDYAPELVISDIKWTDKHPIKQVYMNYDCNTGQRMWDALTAIQTLMGDNLFVLSRKGTVKITEDGQMPFTPDPNGNCYFQDYSPLRSHYYLQLIRDAICAY